MKVVKDTITHNHHYIRNILYQCNHVHVNVLKSYKTVLVILTIVMPTAPTMTVPPSMYDHVGTMHLYVRFGSTPYSVLCKSLAFIRHVYPLFYHFVFSY